MTAHKSWTLALRCYVCGEKFSLYDFELEQLLALVPFTPCPHCHVRPNIAGGHHLGEKTRLHRILYLKEGLGKEGEAIYRKVGQDDAWHSCQACSQWPTAGYIELEMFAPIGNLCSECLEKQGHAEV